MSWKRDEEEEDLILDQELFEVPAHTISLTRHPYSISGGWYVLRFSNLLCAATTACHLRRPVWDEKRQKHYGLELCFALTEATGTGLTGNN